MTISVCIASIRSDTLPFAVRSIIAQTWADWELLVVGQGDDPGLAQLGQSLPTLDARIRYLHLDEQHVSRARNAALGAATGEIIAMTDDDCEAAPDWLAALADRFARYPTVGVVGGALLAPPTSRWRLESCLSRVPAESLYDPADADHAQTPPHAWDWVGANVAVRASVAQAIGLFDDYLGPGAGEPDFPAAEDMDYNMRALAAGVGVLCDPAVVVRHTYGVRRGLRRNLRNFVAYARGNGGLDGKLTLAGDPHGQQSAARVLRTRLNASLRSLKLYRIPLDIAYAVLYRQAYRKALRDYTLAPDGRLAPASTLSALPVRGVDRAALG